MKASINFSGTNYSIDLAHPLDISIPIQGSGPNVNAWYHDAPKIAPHQIGDLPGSVAAGATVNFNDIWFNPHSHGTHTEGVGHIHPVVHSVNKQLARYFFKALLVTIAPEKMGGDMVISKRQLEYAMRSEVCEALVIRTLPNTIHKRSRQYSHTNPPYLLEEATRFLVKKGIDHLLVDLPSVDREKDEGELLSHRAFWSFDGPLRMQATITELVYVPNTIADGAYFLNLQMAAFENDACPSRPVLYKIENV